MNVKNDIREKVIEIIDSLQSLPLYMPQITLIFKNTIVTTEDWESKYISVEHNGAQKDVLYIKIVFGDKFLVIDAGEVCDKKTYALVKDWAFVPSPRILRNEAIRTLGEIVDLY